MNSGRIEKAMQTVLPLLRAAIAPNFAAPLFWQDVNKSSDLLVLSNFSPDVGYISVLVTSQGAQLLSVSRHQQSPPNQIWSFAALDAAMQIASAVIHPSADSPTALGTWTMQPRAVDAMAKLRFVLFDNHSVSPVFSVVEGTRASFQTIRYIVGDNVTKNFVEMRGETRDDGTSIGSEWNHIELDSFEPDLAGHFDIRFLRAWRVSR